MAHDSAEVGASLPLVELPGRIRNGCSVRGGGSANWRAVCLRDGDFSAVLLWLHGRQLGGRGRREAVEVLLLLLVVMVLRHGRELLRLACR